MKSLIMRALHIFGLTALLRFFHTSGLTIVLYHGVAPGMCLNDSLYNYRGKFIEPGAFSHQLHYFARHYQILPLDESLVRLQKGTLPRNTLAITFDDGYRNFYTHAYPLLQKRGLPAAMFLATDFVLERKPLWVDRLEYALGHGKGSKTEKKERDAKMRDELKTLPRKEREERLCTIENEAGVHFEDFSGDRAVYEPLSLEEIREMAKNGITFGAHSQSHPILSKESTADAAEEIRGSKGALERSMSVSSTFAYPNGQSGDWTEENESALHASGFSHALTTIEGVNYPSTPPYRLRRMVMDNTDKGPMFALIASGVRLLLRSLRL